MYTLSGITIAEGVAAGEALILKPQGDQVSLFEQENKLGIIDPAHEQARFQKASLQFAERLRNVLLGPAPDSVRDLFGAVSAYLTDPENTKHIKELIDKGESAANACKKVFLQNLQVFTNSDDAELKAQGRELTALAREFIATLELNAKGVLEETALTKPTVIIANDLTPARFLCLRTDLVSAVVLEGGLSSGHLGTVLRELRIPSIFSVIGATSISDGEHVLVDASNGNVIVEPPTDTTQEILNRPSFSDEDLEDDSDLNVTLAPSIGAMRELEVNSGLLNHGLGLLRSEFLFLGSKIEPSEDEMTEIFSALFKRVPNFAPISARTFDFAGDKKPFFCINTDESGPLKGYGANVGSELLKKELRSLLRAAPNREISIIFPLISRMSEANYLTSMLCDVADELDFENQKRASFKVVFMIETPAAVLSAEAFASISSMFLIGTSSLDEYASAPRTPGDAFTPALAKMIAMACKGAADCGVQVGIAGRYAHRTELLPFFLKLGISYFTVDSYSLTKLKQGLEQNPIANLEPKFEQSFYEEVMSLATGREISTLINNLNFNG